MIDTSIWVDLYEDRKGYNKEPLGHFAFKLFNFIKAKDQKIAITDLIIKELEGIYSIQEINGMMTPFKNMFIRIISSRKQHKEAESTASTRGIPKGDALHAIMARDSRLILITRDKHFKILRDISESYKPEELI